MEVESPADAWYTWVAVALVSIAVGGVVIGLPRQPPPDATGGANTIDRVATSRAGSGAAYQHSAAEVRIGTRQLWLRNDGGTSHASVGFDSLMPIHATEGRTREAARRLLEGRPPQWVLNRSSFSNETALREALATARRILDEQGPEWRPADGAIRVRTVSLAGERLILVAG